MTTPTDPGRPDPAAQMEAATADLQHLQDLLRRAGQGQAGAGEVTESLNRYWSDHRDAFKIAARALGEEVRGQMLDQLYRMREQLGRQLEGQRVSVPGASVPGASVPGQPTPDTATEQPDGASADRD
jgi:hypothetical protein